MDIFLCLVSYQFLASDYIHDVELPRAEARHKNGEIEVVPVVVYPMDLKSDCEFLYQFNPCSYGVSAGGILKRTATGTTRFIPSVTASSRRSRKRAAESRRLKSWKRPKDNDATGSDRAPDRPDQSHVIAEGPVCSA